VDPSAAAVVFPILQVALIFSARLCLAGRFSIPRQNLPAAQYALG
jgi:hypothetical protein